MPEQRAISRLRESAATLRKPFPLLWRYPVRAPSRPLSARMLRTWPEYRGGPGPWKKNGENWLYTEFTFPSRRDGVNLAGTTAELYIAGWQPFTLWIDGEELFREEHVWKATGPIADPFPLPIVPGRRHRLVVCIVPPELPDGSLSLRVDVRSRACHDIALEFEAAAGQLELAGHLAATPGERGLVKRAASAVDLDSVGRRRWARALRSIASMEQMLAPLSPKAKELTVHLVGHSHIDMDWKWTWPDTVSCIRRDLKAVTDLMESHPELTFTHSQIPTYDTVKRLDPAVFARIRKRVAEGRWENAAGTWVEGDLNMADGEAFARHVLYARDWTRENLGSEATVLWEPDTFGHPGNMPQLARLGGFGSYYHMRCNPGNEDTWSVWQWVGVDGTAVTAFSKVYIDSILPDRLFGTAIVNYRRGVRNALHVWGIGDHGGALARVQLEALERYRHRPLTPTVRFSTMADVTAAIEQERPELPSSVGEHFSLFEGCFTTHAAIKLLNRRGECALLEAETLSAMAGIDSRDELRRAWVPALFNQFHDILDGAAVHDAYIDASKRAARARRGAERVSARAVAGLTRTGRSPKQFAVVNSLGFGYRGPVRAMLPRGTEAVRRADGTVSAVQPIDREYLFVAGEVAPCSVEPVQALTSGAAGAHGPVAVEEEREYWRVETRFAVARISKDHGTIGSYFDKRLGYELVAYGVPKHLTHVPTTRGDLALNVLQIIDESPNTMSAWLINSVMREENLLDGARVELIDRGPVFARLRVTRTFRNSSVTQDLIFYNDLPRVELDLTVDWREAGSAERGVPQLKLSFGTGLPAPRLRTEGPFCVTERPANGMEFPTQKWVDLANDRVGFAVLNDRTYGCDALGGRLRMTLLRNPYGPDLETDNGVHRFRFAFVPHGPGVGNAQLVRAGMAFNRMPRVLASRTGERDSRLAVEGADSVVCTAVRRAEHSDGVLVRLFECEGVRCHARLRIAGSVRSAREVDFLERHRGTAARIENHALVCSFRPWEVKTLLLR